MDVREASEPVFSALFPASALDISLSDKPLYGHIVWKIAIDANFRFMSIILMCASPEGKPEASHLGSEQPVFSHAMQIDVTRFRCEYWDDCIGLRAHYDPYPNPVIEIVCMMPIGPTFS